MLGFLFQCPSPFHPFHHIQSQHQRPWHCCSAAPHPSLTMHMQWHPSCLCLPATNYLSLWHQLLSSPPVSNDSSPLQCIAAAATWRWASPVVIRRVPLRQLQPPAWPGTGHARELKDNPIQSVDRSNLPLGNSRRSGQETGASWSYYVRLTIHGPINSPYESHFCFCWLTRGERADA